MTLDEARHHIGDAVVYDDGFGKREDGTIVHVGSSYAFVRYGHNDTSVKATPVDRLTLLSGAS